MRALSGARARAVGVRIGRKGRPMRSRRGRRTPVFTRQGHALGVLVAALALVVSLAYMAAGTHRREHRHHPSSRRQRSSRTAHRSRDRSPASGRSQRLIRTYSVGATRRRSTYWSSSTTTRSLRTRAASRVSPRPAQEDRQEAQGEPGRSRRLRRSRRGRRARHRLRDRGRGLRRDGPRLIPRRVRRRGDAAARERIDELLSSTVSSPSRRTLSSNP